MPLLVGVVIVASRAADSSGTGHPGPGMVHRHDQWVEPPAEYRELRNPSWGEPAAITRGARLFAENCVPCHGEGGVGDGRLAAGLAHPPADLTRPFQPGAGFADGYLFWRVTQGGGVAPFAGMGSQMPAFSDLLTVDQRWSVIAYIGAALARVEGRATPEQPVWSRQPLEPVESH